MTETIKQRTTKIKHGVVPTGYKEIQLGIVPVEWKITRFGKKFMRISRRNTEGDKNVLTISAQYGLISQDDFFKKNIASENVDNYYLLNKGEYAYNKSYSNGYRYGALKRLSLHDKGIVSPLYICFAKTDANKCTEYYTHYFEAGLMNHEIKAYAQEGARNHGLLNIGIEDFFNSLLIDPPLPEQQKIAEILTTCDGVIALKEKLLVEKKEQKKWLMQNLLTGKKRLDGFSGEWKRIKLSKVLEERKEKNLGHLTICSVSVAKGVINQIEHLGRSYAAKDTSNYNKVCYGDIIYTKSPTGDFPYGIIKQSHLRKSVVVSPLYGVYKPSTYALGYILHTYFSHSNNTNNYLYPIVNRGAKHTMNISNDMFISKKMFLPIDKNEQIAIAEILSTADHEIDLLQQDINQWKQKKKALMQLLLTGIVRVKL